MNYTNLFLKELEKENSEEFIQEKMDDYNYYILPFYKKNGKIEQFSGRAGIPISCRIFRHPLPAAKLILVTGYNESYLKYAEFIKNLYELNISVYCYDHRGQGYSGRFNHQNKRGYIDYFPYLVDDFCTFYQKANADGNKQMPLFVFGHSMGGAVVTHALCDKKINPVTAILSAPLFELPLTPFPILELPIQYLAQTCSLLGLEKSYAFGQKDCLPFLPFESNDVTHSKYRFFTWRKHIAEISQMQLGGVTFGWLAQATPATRKIRKRCVENQIPMVILQAEEDTVVNNRAHDLFVNSCSVAKKVVCEGARHEILMEIDFIRNKALDVIKNTILNKLHT